MSPNTSQSVMCVCVCMSVCMCVCVVVLFTVVNTDPKCYWLTNYVEVCMCVCVCVCVYSGQDF